MQTLGVVRLVCGVLVFATTQCVATRLLVEFQAGLQGEREA